MLHPLSRWVSVPFDVTSRGAQRPVGGHSEQAMVCRKIIVHRGRMLHVHSRHEKERGRTSGHCNCLDISRGYSCGDVKDHERRHTSRKLEGLDLRRDGEGNCVRGGERGGLRRSRHSPFIQHGLCRGHVGSL